MTYNLQTHFHHGLALQKYNNYILLRVTWNLQAVPSLCWETFVDGRSLLQDLGLNLELEENPGVLQNFLHHQHILPKNIFSILNVLKPHSSLPSHRKEEIYRLFGVIPGPPFFNINCHLQKKRNNWKNSLLTK